MPTINLIAGLVLNVVNVLVQHVMLEFDVRPRVFTSFVDLVDIHTQHTFYAF